MTRDTGKLLALFTVAALLIALVVVFGPAAAQGADVCPEEGKVEANGGNQDEINELILPAGTEVCIKGGQDLVTVAADGESTLAELLGNGKDVSHYTVLEVPPSTTTTIPSTTTTTVQPTTTTQPPTTTSSTVTSSTTTTTVPETTSTPPERPVTSTSVPPMTTPPTLPFTGTQEVGLLAGLAMTLISIGGLVMAAARKLDPTD